MRITARAGTIRIEEKGKSSAWPLYMAIPAHVQSTLIKNVFARLKLEGDPKNMPESILAQGAEIDIELCGCKVSVDGSEITPSTVPAHAKAVVDVIYAHDNGLFAEIYALRQLKDEPDTTEKKPKDVIQIIDGIPTIVEGEEDVTKAEEVIGKDGKGTGRFMQVPILIKGKKVPQAKRDRLAELEAKDALL